MNQNQHRETVLNYIRENGPCSLSDIRRGTSLSFTTIRIEVAVLEALKTVKVKWVGNTKLLSVVK